MKDARRIGVYGASGSGKSTLVKAMIAKAPRVVVFDPMDEYARALRFHRADTLAGVLEAIKRGWAKGFRIAYVPPANAEPDALHRLSCLLLAVNRPYRESVHGIPALKTTLVVEELNLSFPVTGLPAALSGFPELCSRGRHSGIEMIGVTQRVAEVNTRFRSNTEDAYFFRQGDNRDVGFAVAKLGAKWRAAIMGMQTHDYIKSSGGITTQGRNPLRRKAS